MLLGVDDARGFTRENQSKLGRKTVFSFVGLYVSWLYKIQTSVSGLLPGYFSQGSFPKPGTCKKMLLTGGCAVLLKHCAFTF